MCIFVQFLELVKHWKKIYAKYYIIFCGVKCSRLDTKNTVIKEITNRHDYMIIKHSVYHIWHI